MVWQWNMKKPAKDLCRAKQRAVLCLNISTHAHINAETHVGLLSLPSRSANMKEGALLSVVSRSMNALGWPAASEPGSSSSIPPA